ncbi:MAG: hypothetical protein QG657_230 [Acidobacteriota bacterium]|nr:hypothetical protein [Acidobacteriota bacterium]
MLLVGNYPFIISVWNFFAPPDEGQEEIRFKVTFTQNRCYYEENRDFKAENKLTESQYLIKPGISLAFPMYFGDEILLIELDPDGGNPDSPFHLSAGATAENFPNTILGVPSEGSYFDKRISPKGEPYYVGGTWTVDPIKKAGWQLTIKKFGPDPQSDDVTVGPGTPG